MSRTRRRSLWLALLAGLAVPASASASDFTIAGTDYSGPGLSDGIFSAGETIDATFALLAGTPWEGGRGSLSVPAGAKVSFPDDANGPGYLRDYPAAGTGTATMNERPFRIKLEPGYVCGENVPLSMLLSGPSGPFTVNPVVPTGAAGAEHRYVSDDVGDQIYDSQIVDSGVSVGDDGLVKKVRVKIDSLQNIWGLRWYDLYLKSPSGKKVRIFHQRGGSAQLQMTNVTFDDDAATDVSDTSISSFSNISVRPDESLSAFEGEVAKGDWTLEVEDVHDPGKPRTGQGRAGTGRADGDAAAPIGLLGGWSLGIARAVCSTVPDAWFGPEPLVVDPDGGTVLDASSSKDPGTGGAITQYAWDLTAPSGYEVTGTTPTTVFPASPKGKRPIRLQITDNASPANVTEITREVIITKPPVIGAELAMSPTFPNAGETVTLTATASDPDGLIAKVEWDFDRDGKFERNGGTSLQTTHSWPKSGPQVVRMRVTDDVGAMTVRTFNIGVKNQPPKVVLSVVAKTRPDGKPAASAPGQDIVLDASQTTDPDGSPGDLQYMWDLDGDGEADYTTSTGNVPTAKTQFAQPGTYPVGVTVSDALGASASARIDVEVTAKPVARLSLSNATPAPGETVTFDASASSDSDGSIVGYQWSLDGGLPKAGDPVQRKAYPNVSAVVVRLIVTDESGATGETTAIVRVTAPATGGPAPVPTPTPAPGGGNSNVPKPGPGTGAPGTVPNPDVAPDTPGLDLTAIPINPKQAVPNAAKAFTITDEPESIGQLPNGFAASLGVASKQKAKKVLKGGIIVKITVNAPGTVVVKGMLDAKLAKQMGLKPKKKLPLAVASGKLVFTKPGTFKFVVKVPKKYQRSVKKSKSTKITLRAAVTDKKKQTLAIGKAVVVIK